MPYLETRILLKVDDVNIRGLFAKLREQDGLSEDEAAKEMRKRYPLFGKPDDTSQSTGEDRPLPYELKNRINIFVQKRLQKDPETLKKRLKNHQLLNLNSPLLAAWDGFKVKLYSALSAKQS